MGQQGPEDRVVDWVALHNPVLNNLIRPGLTLADRAKEIMCSTNAIGKTQQIFAKLSARYPIALGSNKGTKTIERLIKSSALALLQYAFIFTCDAHDKAQDGIFYKKPDPAYFVELKKIAYAKGFTDNTLIFIDNEKANVQAACDAGMIGIHYTSAEQLAADFHKLGIFLE